MDKERVEVWGIAIDPFNQSPIVVLRSKENPREILPIWIGHPEAAGIWMVLNGEEFVRPLTYDLFKNVLESLKATVERVEITDIKEGTYYATLFVKDLFGNVHEIDARPSDAINLALRFNAPIYVSKRVMESSKVVLDEKFLFPQGGPSPFAAEGKGKAFQNPEGEKGEKNPPVSEQKGQTEGDEVESGDIKSWLENIKPEDFSKFGGHDKGEN